MNVRGLHTAATLWASTAAGSCAGADMVAQSAALTLFVIAGNTLLRPLVNAIDRIPRDERASEANYVVYRSNDNVEISAPWVSLTVDPKDLDKTVAELSKLAGVRHATWNVSALE
jgi:putative Mg2+ transporter-C (MgtC) family protein